MTKQETVSAIEEHLQDLQRLKNTYDYMGEVRNEKYMQILTAKSIALLALAIVNREGKKK